MEEKNNKIFIFSYYSLILRLGFSAYLTQDIPYYSLILQLGFSAYLTQDIPDNFVPDCLKHKQKLSRILVEKKTSIYQGKWLL